MSSSSSTVCGKPVAAYFINSHLDLNCSSEPALPRTSAAPSSSSSTITFSTKKRKSLSNDPPPPPTSIKSESTPAPPKRFKSTQAVQDAQPLAERVRPQSLDEFIGQEQLLGEGALMRGLIEKDKIGSLILWGPPGTGKTTIARLIAKSTKSVFKELSATSASTADLRKVFDDALNLLKLTGRKTILFIDEIQRFSKSQQDNFLPVVENGSICLIASTTENPSFRLNGALLSRCRVFVLNKLTPDDIYNVLIRALSLSGQHGQPSSSSPPPSTSSPLASTSSAPPPTPIQLSPPIDEQLLRFLASAADGDARVALSSLELALNATSAMPNITTEDLKTQLRRAHLQYDRSGDHHYDTISALHKSVRGGDANAALYWLARMLQGGDDPLYVARRMIRMASEDIGQANPIALQQAVSAYQATQLIGMPECDCILAQVVVMLAESPKSVRSYKAYNAAKALVDREENYPVPLHIRNAPTGLMKSLGYGKDYLYNPSYAHPVPQTYLPPELEGKAAFLKDEGEDAVWDDELLKEWEGIVDVTTNEEHSGTSSDSDFSDDLTPVATPPKASDEPTMTPTEPRKETLQKRDYRPKSTLHLKQRSEMDFWERIVARGLMAESYHELKPASLDRGSIPQHSTIREHLWIMSRGGVALGLQALSYWIWPQFQWPLWLAYIVYQLNFGIFAIRSVRRFDYWAGVYGTYDEKQIGRDRIPDVSIGQLARGFLATLVLRTAGEFTLRWDASASPIHSFSLMTPVKMFAWLITLDYFFYSYHRACHEVDWLWRIHQKHHTTRHPSPALVIMADGIQEAIEIVLCPLAATLLVPMNFHELYLMVCYTAYVEIFGHSGIRADWDLPITGPILKLFGAELIVEDHDLHHRLGKSGKNYGKQSRLWDCLFGTTTPRREMANLAGHRAY
ncbi:Werner helicase interacting protein 1 [Pseudohyphozyma bogoriensis]|nr:Werner helicase interacting protein 1 [Pseudohyphozyma bogoriensis]